MLKGVEFGVEKNLMRSHAVALEDGGKDVVFLVETQVRECVLFIGTRFSNLYTAVDTPAEAA